MGFLLFLLFPYSNANPLIVPRLWCDHNLGTINPSSFTFIFHYSFFSFSKLLSRNLKFHTISLLLHPSKTQTLPLRQPYIFIIFHTLISSCSLFCLRHSSYKQLKI